MTNTTGEDGVEKALARQAAERTDAEERVAKRSRSLKAALVAHGITSIDVLWDGCGDSGQIDIADFQTDAGPIDATQLSATDSDGEPINVEQLATALVYDLIEVHCPGLENGEGGDASLTYDGQTLTFDVSARTVHSETVAAGDLATEDDDATVRA